MLLERFQLASRPPDREFLFFKDDVWTFFDFCRAVEMESDRLAAEGVQAGTVVAVCGVFSPASVVLAFAAAELKAIVVPLTELSDSVREERFRAAGVEVMVRVNEEGRGKKGNFSRHVSAISERRGSGVDPRSESFTEDSTRHPLITRLTEAGRPGLILFSSGTTGTPKAMLHDLERLVEGYSVKKGPGPRTLAFLYYDHIGGLDILFRALASGASLVIPEGRDPETVAHLIERHRISVLPASPTFLNLLLLSGAIEKCDVSSLEIVGYGSEPMPETLLRRLEAVFPGVELQQKFGTSETNAVRVISRARNSLEMRIEDPEVEWKIVDGELWLKTPSRIIGYLNAESDALTADGWYRTGDLVEETGKGFFRIVGRRSDVINVGGEKVFPLEVENILMEMPAVRECRIFGEHHALTGQIVVAEIVSNMDLSAASLKAAIRQFCRNRLEPFKIPVKVYRVEGLKTGGNFKKIRKI